MNLEVAAFVNLVVLARADGLVTASELTLLERYREALGVPKDLAAEILEKDHLKPLGANEILGKPSDKLHILKLMIRLAYADRVMSRRERRLLCKVAQSFGIGRLALKSLFWEIEQELGIRRRLRISQTAVAATLVVAAVVVWLTFQHFIGKAELDRDETRINLDELKEEFELDRAAAEEALATVQESQERLALQEKALSDRLEEMEREDTRADIARLETELQRIRNLNTVFKDMERTYASSILLIFTQYDLEWKTYRVTRGSMGSGFFATSTGHIVTNKHVVQPWKFSADDIMLMDNGFTIDESSIFTAVWPAGTQVKTAEGELSFDAAYTTEKKNLVLTGTTPDTFEIQVKRLETGLPYEGSFHTLDQGDLAVLKALPSSPVKALPIAGAKDRLEKLDPVMVLGFPSGINILESTKAETSPSLGEVRKIEKNILVTAPIVSGNSGGPLMGVGGHVVGVASGSYGEATLGSCIPAEYVFPLLPEAADLLNDAALHEEAGEYRAALDELRLADQRCEDDMERKTIDATRTRLFGIRDHMLDDAKQAEEGEARTRAYQEILDRFGAEWAREALEFLNGS